MASPNTEKVTKEHLIASTRVKLGIVYISEKLSLVLVFPFCPFHILQLFTERIFFTELGRFILHQIETDRILQGY